jgi:hypothetical protein
MAKEQIPVIEVTTGISESGEEFTHPEVSKFFEVYDRAEKKRNNLYQLMMATRKDKKNMGEQQVGIHDIIAKVVDVDNNGGFIEEERPDQFKDEEVK